jgi:hypothetical protein
MVGGTIPTPVSVGMASVRSRSAWKWGRAPWSARLFSTVLLIVLLLIPSIATLFSAVFGDGPRWLGIPSSLGVLLVVWIWLRIGVEWTGETLIIRNRLRTARIAGSEIVGFALMPLDRVVPNLPQTISVTYRGPSGERRVQIVATAVREGDTEVRRWYAAQFAQVGPGLNTVLQMRYAHQGPRRTLRRGATGDGL